jgi:hypothetical protein
MTTEPRIRYWVDSGDEEAWEVARRLKDTNVEVTVSRMDPVLWVDGVCYYGIDDIRRKVKEILGD